MDCEVINAEVIEAPRSVLARFSHWVRARRQQRMDRAEFRKILKLEDHLLSDIGVNRDSVDWAQGLPASRNPGFELAKTVGRIGVITPK